MVGPTTPLVVAYCRPPTPIAVVYFTESAKNASSAVIRFRRSDFIEARYAFSFVFANFGIAIAAKMPMITTTIRSSISVKPLRFIWNYLPYEVQRIRVTVLPPPNKHESCLGSRTPAQLTWAPTTYAYRNRFSYPRKTLKNSGFLQAGTPDARKL